MVYFFDPYLFVLSVKPSHIVTRRNIFIRTLVKVDRISVDFGPRCAADTLLLSRVLVARKCLISIFSNARTELVDILVAIIKSVILLCFFV